MFFQHEIRCKPSHKSIQSLDDGAENFARIIIQKLDWFVIHAELVSVTQLRSFSVLRRLPFNDKTFISSTNLSCKYIINQALLRLWWRRFSSHSESCTAEFETSQIQNAVELAPRLPSLEHDGPERQWAAVICCATLNYNSFQPEKSLVNDEICTLLSSLSRWRSSGHKFTYCFNCSVNVNHHNKIRSLEDVWLVVTTVAWYVWVRGGR